MRPKPDPQRIKALAIDLDGTTLLPNAILGERTRLCIRKLISNGMQIIISTGRAIEASERFLVAMSAHGPMVFFNGAEVVDIPSGKVLHANMIDMDVVDFGTDIARSLGVYFQVYLPAGISPVSGKKDPQQKWEALLSENYSEEAQMYYDHTGIKPVVTDLKKIAAMSRNDVSGNNASIDGCIKGMYIADPSHHDEIRRRMRERFGEQVSVIRSYPTFLEVINNGVSKGEGLKIAMRHRGLKPEEVIAFGDEENDLPMFEVAGFAAAPANAREKIRAAADLIYGPNTEEGLAAYLEKTFQI
ncbi:MAG: Cof-type HAD-IIB family hydrolase [Treponema sp.]|jgi:Cof subfamily protein (haloacid dehalogenase superfamily)|nr:Cof-type HAD-IIB family hydrolase [Treponema sp.]